MQTAKILELPAAEYHGMTDHVSCSMLKDFRRSRVYYRDVYVDKTYQPPPKKTSAMDLGTLVHAAILEPHRLEELVCLIPPELLSDDGGIRTKEAKAFVRCNEEFGRIVVKAEAYQQLVAIRDAFYRSKLGPWLTAEKRVESSITWQDESGLLMRCRPDWLILQDGKAVVIDIKTTDDPNPTAFRKNVERFGYWLQQPHYEAGIAAATQGQCAVEWYFAVVGTSYPYQVAVCQIANAVDCYNAYRDTVETLATCYREQRWDDAWTKWVNMLDVRSFVFEE